MEASVEEIKQQIAEQIRKILNENILGKTVGEVTGASFDIRVTQDAEDPTRFHFKFNVPRDWIPTKYQYRDSDLEIVVKDDRGPMDDWKWAIQRSWRESSCLNRDFEWEYQPSPSERDDDFFKRNRFTLDEAKAHCAAYLALPHNNS